MAISSEKRLKIYQRDGFACVKCGRTKKLTLDHILPKDKGGTDDIGNLQTMCVYCNSLKSNFEEKWWHKFMPFAHHTEINKLRNELLAAMSAKDGLVKQGLEKKIIQPNQIENTGLRNSIEGYGKRSRERDEKLLAYINVLAERVKELEEKQKS